MALENAPSLTVPACQQRLGRNQGRYLGETIQIQSVLNDIQAEGLKHGWRSECFLQNPELCLRALHRAGTSPAKKLYLSAGIHGDEPAGPMAVLELLRRNRWPGNVQVWLCPCLN